MNTHIEWSHIHNRSCPDWTDNNVRYYCPFMMFLTPNWSLYLSVGQSCMSKLWRATLDAAANLHLNQSAVMGPPCIIIVHQYRSGLNRGLNNVKTLPGFIVLYSWKWKGHWLVLLKYTTHMWMQLLNREH